MLNEKKDEVQKKRLKLENNLRGRGMPVTRSDVASHTYNQRYLRLVNL